MPAKRALLCCVLTIFVTAGTVFGTGPVAAAMPHRAAAGPPACRDRQMWCHEARTKPTSIRCGSSAFERPGKSWTNVRRGLGCAHGRSHWRRKEIAK
uniref:Uncharacterized protein apoD10 n=1 Tax=Amycolatopsis sp. FU40 TaxID=2914159 RepID=G8EG81_9PSEU|nr:hypothetical protein [Amycolatopsis sp. FU40]